MSDETIAVPRALLTELAKAASESERSALASQAFDLLPMHGPRLVLINLNSPDVLHTQAMWTAVSPLEMEGKAKGLGALMTRIDASPDVMAVISSVVKAWWSDNKTDADVLLDCIRAALEGATQ